MVDKEKAPPNGQVGLERGLSASQTSDAVLSPSMGSAAPAGGAVLVDRLGDVRRDVLGKALGVADAVRTSHKHDLLLESQRTVICHTV